MTPEPEILRPQGRTTLLHHLTYPEVLDSKIPVSDMRGYLVGGPDRKGANAVNQLKLWKVWQEDVQAAGRRHLAVPQYVTDYFQATKKFSAPPREPVEIKSFGSSLDHPLLKDDHEGLFDAYGVPMEDTLNTLDLGMDLGMTHKPTIVPELSGGYTPAAGRFPLCEGKLEKPPRLAFSFTAMEKFMQCPRAWAADKYYKAVPYQETEHTIWGNRVHTAAENYLRNALDGGVRPVEEECLPLVKRYCDFFLSMKGDLHIEKEICCTKDLAPCGWKDWNTVWFRFKGDVLVIKDRRLIYADWKSGKKKDDFFQIEVAVALADLYFPDAFDTADGKLIFVKESDPKKAIVGLPKPITKADIPAIWEKIYAITNRMTEAWEHANFRMQTSGLCKAYCGDLSCIHNGKR